MITILSSPKPGSGTGTTAALLALAVRLDLPTHLVDLCGDQVSLLGLNRGDTSTIHVDYILTVHDVADTTTDEQVALVRRFANTGEHVIIDAGVANHPVHRGLPASAIRRWVLRPCYLALSRTATCPARPDEVIMLDKLGRTLTARNVKAVTGAQVTATIEVHPQIARTVDVGLLTSRAPTTALAVLERLSTSHEAA